MSNHGKKTGKHVGRPTKLTAKAKATILEHVRKGNYFNVAFAAAGISSSTFHYWKVKATEEQAAGDSGPFSQFLKELEKAEAEVEVEIAGLITDNSRKNPETGLKFLARRHPSRWAEANRTKMEVSGPDGGPVKLSWVDLVKLAGQDDSGDS